MQSEKRDNQVFTQEFSRASVTLTGTWEPFTGGDMVLEGIKAMQWQSNGLVQET